MRIRHGVYASHVGAFATAIPDPLLVASRPARDYTIAYQTALEAHGAAHTPLPARDMVTTRTPFRFEYRSYE